MTIMISALLLVTVPTVGDVIGHSSSHNRRSQNLVQTMMSIEEQSKEDRLVNLRIKRSTMERFRLQGYYKSTADEILRGMLDRLETCHCRPLKRVGV
jgi:hypothetical protein